MNAEPIAVYLRIRQIRLTAAGLSWVGQLPLAPTLIGAMRRMPLFSAFYRLVLGYQRPFTTLMEAEAAVSAYAHNGHINPENANLHINLNKKARPSDYAALFHLQRLLHSLSRIYDLGGNVGNLYYCYKPYLNFTDSLSWQVHDLNANMTLGRSLAKENGADNLSFSDVWADASGADLLLVSGSLHYMPESLAAMIAKLDRPPKYIMINRTPMTDGVSFATIQDAGAFRVACMVHNRQALVQELERIGYYLEDSWQAAELSLYVPADPDHTVSAYSGLLLRR